jgi:nicotinamide mononucleotide transporter
MIAPIERFLSIENIAFTIIGYPMSYVELLGTILTLWSVWLIAKRRVLTWPVGIVSSVLYLVLFYQIKLYSDTIEQIYYIITNIYGWWAWNKSPQDNGQVIGVRYNNRQRIAQWIVLTLILSAIAGLLMSLLDHCGCSGDWVVFRQGCEICCFTLCDFADAGDERFPTLAQNL